MGAGEDLQGGGLRAMLRAPLGLGGDPETQPPTANGPGQEGMFGQTNGSGLGRIFGQTDEADGPGPQAGVFGQMNGSGGQGNSGSMFCGLGLGSWFNTGA